MPEVVLLPWQLPDLNAVSTFADFRALFLNDKELKMKLVGLKKQLTHKEILSSPHVICR